MIEVKIPIKKLFLSYQAVEQFLSEKAFEKYADSHKQIYAVWEPELFYFEIHEFFEDDVELVCLTLKELEDYFLNGGKTYATR